VRSAEKSGAHPIIPPCRNFWAVLGLVQQGRDLSGGEWQKIALAWLSCATAMCSAGRAPPQRWTPTNAVFQQFRETTETGWRC
jgi:hypothetical protein